jgi:hypothetical protein
MAGRRGKSIRLDGAAAQAFMEMHNEPKTMDDVYRKLVMAIHLAVAEGEVEKAIQIVNVAVSRGEGKLRELYHIPPEA